MREIVGVALGGCLLVTACGSATMGPATAPHDSGPEDRADAGAEARDAADACELVNGGDAAIATENGGSVIISAGEGPSSNGTYRGLIQAYFYRAGQRGYAYQERSLDFLASSDDGCQPITTGPCTIVTNACLAETAACGVPSAGVISDSDPGSSDMELKPNPNGTYTLENVVGSPLFVAGDVVTVEAAGGDVAPFLQNIVAPGCITMTAPATPDGGTIYGRYAISTASDFQVSWTGGEAGALVGVTLAGEEGKSGVEVAVTCSFDATAGQGTIPQAAIASLAGGPGSFFIYQERRVAQQAGSFHVETVARNFGSGPADAGCPLNNAGAMYQ